MNEIRYAIRQLVKQPSFTIIAVFALALGIGATTTMFSIIDAVLIRPLPYPNSQRLVTIAQTIRSTGVATHDASPANFLDWSAQNTVFSAMTAARGWQANLSGSGEPQRIRASMASSQFFTVFGVQPIIGRSFGANDAKPGASHVAVLSYGFWARRYGADRTIVGRDLILDGEKFTIVGVMPPAFSPDQYGELWVPSPYDVPTHSLAPTADPRAFRDRNYLEVWARLKDGVTLPQANAEMDAIAQRLERDYANANQDVGVTVVPMYEQFVGNIRPMLLLLFGAVGLVLLIGCANVANLLLARAVTRSREMAIRTALGASRWHLIRQLLSESALLALLGGGGGLLLAVWALPAFVRLAPPDLAEFTGINVNTEVLLFTTVISIATGLIFGLAPAVFASRSDPNEALHEGERGSSGRSSARSFLIAAEIAMSFVLLVDAGLLMKSFVRVTQVDPGFNPNGLLVFNIGVPASATLEQEKSLYSRVLDGLTALPGAESVGAVSRLPLSGGNSSRSFNIRGTTQPQSADIRIATPDYFQAMQIPLLRGRNFNAHDTGTSAPVAMINQAAAETMFAGRDPIGETVENFGPDHLKLQIVGVIGNVRHVGLDTGARAEIYQPLAQARWPLLCIVIRSSVSNPLTLLPAAQRVVRSVDPNLPLASPRTMQDVLEHSMVRRKFFMLLLSAFAALATLLAAIGLYGVIAFSVAQRTKEIGIRIALGGQRVDVLSLVLRQSAALVLIGAGIGVPVALGASRLLGRMLYAVRPTDVATYLCVLIALGTSAFLASIIPAIRAAKVNPIVALRHE